MDQKLKVLTDKLYQEGVEKGKQQADQLIEDAKKQAEKIIADAKVKATAIETDANKKAAELDKNTKSELQLASRQLVSSLEQELVNLVNGNIVSSSVSVAIDDPNFIQQLILAAVSNWAPKQDLLVVVAPDAEKGVLDFFTAKAKSLLNSGLKIESANNIKAGFQIGPADGSYKVSFTSNDFIEFFKAYLRPKVVDLLFDRK